jgi:hypothetical protein
MFERLQSCPKGYVYTPTIFSQIREGNSPTAITSNSYFSQIRGELPHCTHFLLLFFTNKRGTLPLHPLPPIFHKVNKRGNSRSLHSLLPSCLCRFFPLNHRFSIPPAESSAYSNKSQNLFLANLQRIYWLALAPGTSFIWTLTQIFMHKINTDDMISSKKTCIWKLRAWRITYFDIDLFSDFEIHALHF